MIAGLIAIAFACGQPVVVDGDTIRCGRNRVRLAGIDAPELHGCHGRPGRVCVSGDGAAAKAGMARLIDGRPLRCVQTGVSYDRRVAWCAMPGGRDLSCAAIGAGIAYRWPRYDPARRLVRC